MCNRLFERAAGIKLRYVPFNSGGECITALLGGHVDMIWANPGEFVPQWEAKMVRPIAVAKETRMPEFPDVPTFKEMGYNVTFKMFRGMAAAPGIPAEAAAFYENMIEACVRIASLGKKNISRRTCSARLDGKQGVCQVRGPERGDFLKVS